MSTSQTTLRLSPPPAFLCSASQKVMSQPVLSLCGHMFEKTVLEGVKRCPFDQMPLEINRCIPFSELQKVIEVWQSHSISKQKGPAQKSYLDALGRNADESLEKQLSSLQLENQEKAGPPGIKVQKRIRNAHQDDIHGFVSISGESFVSGSKDNTLKIWNNNGSLIQELRPGTTGYEYWVTALASFHNGFWASGTRNGEITVWNPKGEYVTSLKYNPSSAAKNQYVCKARNKLRINCISECRSSDSTLEFYTGTAKFIQLWDAKAGNLVRYWQADNNDWVYCIEVMENEDLIVVIGSRLEMWKMKGRIPRKSNLIVESSAEKSAHQRPHISSIKRLEHDTGQLAAALFDGTVRVVDLSSQKTVRHYQEHQGRVWSVINLRPHIFASSADDKKIKIWDLRQSNSVITEKKNPGRVSSLLRLSSDRFISGSCPDDVFRSEEKANITFWDIRI